MKWVLNTAWITFVMIVASLCVLIIWLASGGNL